MADDNFDIAKDFAEATGSDVEMVNESVPDTNSGDMTQNSTLFGTFCGGFAKNVPERRKTSSQILYQF